MGTGRKDIFRGIYKVSERCQEKFPHTLLSFPEAQGEEYIVFNENVLAQIKPKHMLFVMPDDLRFHLILYERIYKGKGVKKAVLPKLITHKNELVREWCRRYLQTNKIEQICLDHNEKLPCCISLQQTEFYSMGRFL